MLQYNYEVQLLSYHVVVDERHTPLSCEPEWIQETLARFISTTNNENIKLTRCVHKSVF